MENIENLNWQDPRKSIWGFHIHQEVDLNDFDQSLIMCEKCEDFLTINEIAVDSASAFKPGYGPHENYMWELRIESITINLLEKLGIAAAYLALNRFQFNPYIHPLMHNRSLSEEDALIDEGQTNQMNTIWFGEKTNQNQDFFFHPPKDAHNKILDTRKLNIFSDNEVQKFKESGRLKVKNDDFKDPFQEAQEGFQIEILFSEAEEHLSKVVLNRLEAYLVAENPILPFARLGLALGWLICNRQNLSILVKPITKTSSIKEQILI